MLSATNYTIFLQWGCFPEVTLERSDEIRARLLSQYLDDTLFKDVVMRHQIRDACLLRDMAVYLLTHTACRITLQSLRKIFGISLDMARAYLTYLEESYLIGEVRSHARSLKAQQVAPRKVYAGDLGLRHVAALTAADLFPGSLRTLITYDWPDAEIPQPTKNLRLWE